MPPSGSTTRCSRTRAATCSPRCSRSTTGICRRAPPSRRSTSTSCRRAPSSSRRSAGSCSASWRSLLGLAGWIRVRAGRMAGRRARRNAPHRGLGGRRRDRRGRRRSWAPRRCCARCARSTTRGTRTRTLLAAARAHRARGRPRDPGDRRPGARAVAGRPPPGDGLVARAAGVARARRSVQWLAPGAAFLWTVPLGVAGLVTLAAARRPRAGRPAWPPPSCSSPRPRSGCRKRRDLLRFAIPLFGRLPVVTPVAALPAALLAGAR